MFFYINIKYYNKCYVLLYFNYYATLQGRCQEEQKTMSTPWPTHKNTLLNQELNKHLQNGTHTIRYCWILESVSHWHARSSTEAPDAEQYCSRHCAFKLSGLFYVDSPSHYVPISPTSKLNLSAFIGWSLHTRRC